MDLSFAHNHEIYLRNIAKRDAEFILELTNSPGWLKYIGDKHIGSKKDAINFIKTGPLQTVKNFGYGLNVIALKDTQKAVGVCGLLKRSYLDAPDLGYALLPEFYRRGYAKTSSRWVIKSANLLEIPYLFASTSPDNSASVALLESLGFVRDGTLLNEQITDPLYLFKLHLDKI